MTAVALLARINLRNRWPGLLVITFLAAASGAVGLTAVAGTRRTATSLERALDAARTADLAVSIGDLDVPAVAAARTVPGTERSAVAAKVAVRPAGTSLVAGRDVVGVLPLNDRHGTEVDIPRLSSGRLPRPERPHEVAVSPGLARRLDLGVGDRLTLEAYSQPDVQRMANQEGIVEPQGARLATVVVGIAQPVEDAVARDKKLGLILLSPAVFAQHGLGDCIPNRRVGSCSEVNQRDPAQGHGGLGVFGVELRGVLQRGPGGDRQRLVDTLTDLYRRTGADAVLSGTSRSGSPEVISSNPRATIGRRAADAIGVEAAALGLFAAGALLAGLVASAQAASRQAFLWAQPHDATLRGLGLDRRQRTAGVFLPLALGILGGSVLATLGAVLASPLLPRGMARRLEPHPGVALEAFPLLPAAGALASLLLAGAALSSWRFTGGRSRPEGAPGRWLRTLERPLPAVGALGLRMAMRAGRGPTRVPTRPALLAAVTGLAGVVGALTFGTSLDRLVTNPPAHGNDWDLQLTVPESRADVIYREAPRLLGDGRIASLSHFRHLELSFAPGTRVPGLRVEPLVGDAGPTVVAGRLPTRPDEVALRPDAVPGRRPGLGDTASALLPLRSVPLRVVGLLSPISSARFVVSQDVGLVPVAADPFIAGESETPAVRGLLVRWSPGVNRREAAAELAASFWLVATPAPPSAVANLAGVQGLPYAFAGFLALLALAAVGHLVITTVNRRRRDLAVLKAIGFLRKQVRGVVAGQALTVATLGVVAGIPLGLALGRGGWARLRSSLGGLPVGTSPVRACVLVALSAVVAAMLLSMFPGRVASGTRPAEMLRAE